MVCSIVFILPISSALCYVNVRLTPSQRKLCSADTRTLLVSQTPLQLRRPSLQCSWTSSLELPSDGSQRAGLVI